jgi:hypothetical protein
LSYSSLTYSQLKNCASARSVNVQSVRSEGK